jgi:AcrR family transcriptional regulator
MSTDLTKRKRYAGTEERREAVIQSAWEVFASRGFRGGSLREIAETVGLTQAGILHHFGTKENLLFEVLAYRERLNIIAPSVQGIGLFDHLRAIVVRNSQTPGAVALFVTMSAEATDPDHPAHGFFVDRYKRTIDLFASNILLARLDGDLDVSIDPQSTAEELVAFLDGLQLQWLLNPALDMLNAFDRYIAKISAIGR